MEEILQEKLRTYIIANNLDLILTLPKDYSFGKYLTDKVQGVMPLVEQMQIEDRPQYIIEEECMRQLTSDLRPSKYLYIQEVFKEEFPAEYQKMTDLGILTYETVNMIELCKDHFESFEFSEETEDSRFLRYAVIAEISGYVNE